MNEFTNLSEQLHRDAARLSQSASDLDARGRQAAETANDLEQQRKSFTTNLRDFESRKIQYDSLLRENSGLKQDLFNLSVKIRKQERDNANIVNQQQAIDQKANELGSHYLKESVMWIAARLNPNNYASCKERLLSVIAACRGIGLDITVETEEGLVQDLKAGFEKAVRDEFARQEQARIRSQIREQERLEREMQKHIQDAEREKAAIQAALDKALKEAQDEHSSEVELLRTKLKEAEEKAQRAISQAQLTKAGYVYVMSNIGSFGPGVFKVGMTRRLEPDERIDELSNASVPFPFDVHMMISCNDAPSLENALHRELHKQRVNRVNFRKEFFRVDFDVLREIVEKNHGDVEYVAEPESPQYYESINTKDEDYEFIEKTVQSIADVIGQGTLDD